MGFQWNKPRPLLILELTIIQSPEKYQQADHKTGCHVCNEIRIVHNKNRSVLRVASSVLRAASCVVNAQPGTRNASTRLRFPGRIDAARFCIGVTLVDKINGDVITDFPDLL